MLPLDVLAYKSNKIKPSEALYNLLDETEDKILSSNYLTFKNTK